MRTIIVAPTYNERDNIAMFLTKVRHALPHASVLIVDDNSPDGTGELAESVASDLGMIKVLHRSGKQGLGSAYRHGFDVARDEGYEVVVSMDVDLSHDPNELPTMLEVVAVGADVVVGSRYIDGGSTMNWPLHRRILSRWGNRYTAFALGINVRDCTSGYRAYRATALELIEPHTTAAEGYAFLTELMRRSARQGLRIVERPITFRDRVQGSSKMSLWIVLESMLLVTGWGLTDIVRGRRGCGLVVRPRPGDEPPG